MRNDFVGRRLLRSFPLPQRTNRFGCNFYLVVLSLFLLIASTSYVKAQSGEALHFDGVDDYVSLPNVLSGSYTKEAWINTSNLSAFNNIISGTRTALFALNGKLAAGHVFPYTETIDTTALLPNTWYHVAVSYDAATQVMSLYKNGVLVDSAAGVTNYFEFNQFIGAFNANYLFAGTIDEVRIWKTVRTEAQINATMNCALTGDEPGLAVYYSFNQGTAGATNTSITSLTDYQDKCIPLNGSLVNFTLVGNSSNFIAPGAPLTGTCSVAYPNINLTGNSVCIALGDTIPAPLDFTYFGIMGNTPITKTFIIENTGLAALTITGINITGLNAADFQILASPISIAAGSSSPLTIQFNPSSGLGDKKALVTINSDDEDESVYTFAIAAKLAGMGHSLSFDGFNDYVVLPANLISGSYTKEAWINLSNLNAFNNILSGTGTALFAYNGQLSAGHVFPYNAVVDPTPLVANTWYHVAVAYNDTTGTINLFKDGALVSSAVIPTGYTEPVQYIGAFDAQYFLAGKVDEVRIWNKARSVAAIAATWQCNLNGGEPGLIAYYRFNNGLAASNNTGLNRLMDARSVCVGNDATLENFALTGNSSNWVYDSANVIGNCTTGVINLLVTGNSACIANGDSTPVVADYTDFGVFAGSPITRTFQLINTGNATMRIDSVVLSGIDTADFLITSIIPAGVAAGDTINLLVQFSPTTLGVKNARLNIYTDDPDANAYVYSIRGNAILLPISLLHFSACKQGKTALLNWSTGSELNNRGFYIQRSANGRDNWQSLGFVAGLTLSTTLQQYQFIDASPVTGNNFYRLQQVDIDQRFTYSPVRLINFTHANSLQLFPTQNNGNFTLLVEDARLLQTAATLYNAAGARIASILLQQRTQQVHLKQLAAGIYYLRTITGISLPILIQ